MLRSCEREIRRRKIIFLCNLSNRAFDLKAEFRSNLKHAINLSEVGGGLEKLSRQHVKGKLTARERLELLLDEDSFQEYDKLKTHRCTEFNLSKEKYYGDGLVSGHGRIHGKKVKVLKLFHCYFSLLF